MHVLHASKKYQLKALENLCVKFLNKELNAANACSILEHSRFFNEKELENRCMEVIEAQTKEAFSSDGFSEMSRDTLMSVLKSDYLRLPEYDLFRYVFFWGKKRVTDTSAIREALGDVLFQIRFPIMSPEVFSDNVCPTKILTSDEQLQIYRYLTSKKKEDCKPKKFVCEPRKQCIRYNTPTSSTSSSYHGKKIILNNL